MVDFYGCSFCLFVAPAVLVTGLEVFIATAPLQAGVKDYFVANTTVHFASNSPDVSGNGLWKVSIYGSMHNNGTGQRFQPIEQVLDTDQQSQPLSGANDLFFLESPGELDIHSIGCSEYQYVCVDFAKGDTPSTNFDLETTQPLSYKYTLCIQRPCEQGKSYYTHNKDFKPTCANILNGITLFLEKISPSMSLKKSQTGPCLCHHKIRYRGT